MVIKSISVKDIQSLDKEAIEKIGIPGIVLMENAGHIVSNEIRRLLKSRRHKSATIVCGIGNNAGDGFVAARHLKNAGFEVKIFIVGLSEKIKKEALVNFNILKNLKFPITELKEVDETFIKEITNCDVVVDAIFGIGLNRPVKGLAKETIEAINKHAPRIISIDIPSGLDGTTGEVLGACVRASRTVTFTLPKKGFSINQGPSSVGKVIVRDIGIPNDLMDKI